MQLLDALSEDDRRLVRMAMQRRKFAKGMVVFHEGDPGDSCHLVTKGRFSTSITTPLGQSAVMWVPGVGEVFGEMALISGHRTRTATVTALEPSETLELHRHRFDELCADHPALLRVLVEALARHVERTSELALAALYLPVERRAFRQLALLCELYLGPGATGTVALNQEVVAAMAGTTRPTLNRILKQAEADGVLLLGRGRIEVLDRTALDRLAGRR